MERKGIFPLRSIFASSLPWLCGQLVADPAATARTSLADLIHQIVLHTHLCHLVQLGLYFVYVALLLG